ncbi:heme NO-binding domain-containing protein [Pseudaestuariivita atlantica]|uniref:Heme NO-binding protein n=1 Tax=Pseudaestuariivita atlantica TaxID=1317121 RepID=A0A0L1JR22_9RHOB|nr:heme NO-binding domain-containing protein [Pseudaestuariivita atlantica]KNG94239.1 heme NO-binding protein [Pseudaestuariivita atlantica]
MHGLINTAVQSFCRDAYGTDVWNDVLRRSGAGVVEFEAMLTYDDPITDAVVNTMARVLSKPREEVLEDLGTYLVSHPNVENLRRLLRFGGVTFEEFLYSLDDLPDRARLAVPDIDLPQLELCDRDEGEFVLICRSPFDGAGHVFVGILRAMADDYGVLALLEHDGPIDGAEQISIKLLERAFARGRQFDLAVVP